MDERQDGYINTMERGGGNQIKGDEIQIHTLPLGICRAGGKGGYQRAGKAQMSSSDLAGVKKRNFFLV